MRSSRPRLVAILLAVVLLGGPNASRAVRAEGAAPQYVNFNFDQVDLRLLVKLVGDMTGRRFVVDSAVSGKVTVVTPPQIPLDEVYPLFLSILESSGYSIVEKDNLFQVIPLAERAITEAPVVVAGGEAREGVITKVLKIEHVGVNDLKKVLDPLVRGGKTGALAAFGPSNHLIITDTSENIRRVERIIAELDKAGASRAVEVVTLKYIPAEEIAAQLLAAMKGTESAGTSVSRHFQQVAEGVGALPSDMIVVPSPSANSLVLVGTTVQLAEMKRVIDMLDVEGKSGHGRLNAIFLKYLSADEASKSLNALLAKTVEKDQRQRIAIEASTANNALIVDASPADYELVQSLVGKLDQVPQQVLVEILIAEIDVGKNVDFGVEWATIEAPKAGQDTVVGRSTLGESDQIMDLVTKGIFPQGMSIGVARGTFTDSDGVVQPRIPFLIHALAQNRDVNILSSVPLWAQNNIEASVSVVQNIPILRSTIEGGSGTSRDVIQNIDRVDVGIKLKFTPHVNPDEEITMQLNPSIEAIIDEGPEDTFAPTISKREVATTVTVPDKATVIISGLIREDRVKTVNKVPLLGDIPLIGMLFRSQSTRRERTNLLIFVTPHIVTDLKEAEALKETLKERASMDVSATNLSVRTSSGK